VQRTVDGSAGCGAYLGASLTGTAPTGVNLLAERTSSEKQPKTPVSRQNSVEPTKIGQIRGIWVLKNLFFRWNHLREQLFYPRRQNVQKAREELFYPGF